MSLHLLAWLMLAQEGGGPASPFEVNFGLFFWTWLVFIALFLVLRRLAWPVILRNTEQRERRIRKQLEDAEKMNAEAQKLLEEHRKTMAKAHEQIHGLLAEAKAVAEREREALLARARQEQDQILERARREIVSERERAVAQLRREAVDLSLAAAGKLLEARLDSEADRRLVADFLESAERGT
jgi:F-type H+-transporting ATPase subunit b